MRWKLKPKVDIFEWHEWFALYPVIASGDSPGSLTRVWLEKVERRAFDAGYDFVYQYRLLQSNHEEE